MSGLNLILAIVLLFALSSPAGAAPVAPVTRNADWTPVTSVFEDGVTMVLVPPGCFLMGTGDAEIARLNAEYQTDWFSHESPQHEQCFDQPFWIDQTEVTQADFARLGGQRTSPNYFDGELRPVESITWFEARDFCALRGARLPTEREWEYAARGPDGLVYPWGNAWNEKNAVWSRDTAQGTADVGSMPDGASWVGALDMSGNVWEWLNTIQGTDSDGDYNFDESGERLYAYPYRDDGREQNSADGTVVRVLRGGSWLTIGADGLRVAGRYWYVPGSGSLIIGFRCARSDVPAVPLVTDPGASALNPVTRNADWTPVTSVFEDGVTMVLVPPGCFLMGTGDADIARLNAEYQADWFSNESPQHEQCFDQSFWIDQTEVTQADFARLGGQRTNPNSFAGEQRPVDSITWFEARDFCALRGARLPAEREWEYAARGPDGLVYPWGNAWDETKMVWKRTIEQGTEAVGSKPAGASWVGALDMSGNVWEWLNTIWGIDADGDYNLNESGEQLYAYPYRNDGREQDSDDRTFVRVLRGGSWSISTSDFLRAAGRNWNNPDYRYNYDGFRCARSS